MINTLNIYRDGVIITTIDIDESTVYNEKLQGVKSISCSVTALEALPVQKEDYIIFEEERFTINTIPELSKAGETLGKDYQMVFEAPFYHLLDWFVIKGGLKTFPYYSTARGHLQMIFDSANLNSSGWVVGEVDETEEILLNYDWHYVRPALDDIATAFGLEYQFTGKTIRMVKTIGRDTGLVFQIGRGNGLHKIQRSADTSKSAVNRVYGIGGSKNLGTAYRGGLETSLIFEERYVQTPEVTAWLNGTGPEVRIKEAKYVNEEIYPHFSGTVTATAVQTDAEGKVVSATITDPSVDFDVNAYIQEGTKAKISFLSGPLMGVDFEISNFNYGTRTTTLIPNTDTNGYTLPNTLSFPEIGNKYTYLEMKMPDAYIIRAEDKLKAESRTYLDDNKFDRLTYGVEPDVKYLRENQIRLKVGDRGTVVDSEMEVDEMLRFVDISFPLVNPFKVVAVVGNEITYDRVIKLYADVIQLHQQVQVIDRRGAEIAKRNAQNLKVLTASIFDIEGNFDSAKLNVGVLSAVLGIFGIRSTSFLLNRVYISDNYNGDPNALNISAGELIHQEYSNPGEQNIWQMQPFTVSGLLPASFYYVYAKCSRSSQVGSFLLSTDQIKPDDIDGFYTFLTGIVYPVNGTYRDSEFTNGIADINGNRLKIGVIQGVTGALMINLNTGEIFGKLTFRGSNGAVLDVNDVNNKAIQADTNAQAAQVAANTSLAQSTSALKELADIANDGILDTGEKITALKDYRLAESELSSVSNQALTYSVSSAAYQDKFNALQAYLTPLFANMSVNSPIDRTEFINKFRDYYLERQAIYTAVTNAASGRIEINRTLIDGKAYASGKMLYRDAEFREGLNGINVYNNAGNGTVIIYRGLVGTTFTDLPNGSGAGLVIRTNGDASPGLGGFYFANQTRANAIFITRIKALIPAGFSIAWASNQTGDNGRTVWNTSTAGTGKWEEYICTVYCGAAGTFSSTNFFYLSGPGAPVEWYLASATVYDMTAAEIDYSSDAQKKADLALQYSREYADGQIATAKTQILYSASEDAQAKSTAAREAAIFSSKEYAASQDAYYKTLTDAYADGKVSTEEQARIYQAAANLQAAKEDATNKANAARDVAQAAQNAYNTLTAQLKETAYQNIADWAIGGNSVFNGGMLNTLLINSAAIWTNILNAGYINTQQLQATSGSIGGWNISNYNLTGGNGNTTIELNVTNIDPFIQISAANGNSTRINYEGIRTNHMVTDDILINKVMFINADHIFMKTGIGSNGEDLYGGRVGDYGSNGFAFVERNGGNLLVNITDINVNRNLRAGTVGYYTLTNLSDMRFKKAVKKLSYGLKEVMALKPISFKYKLPDEDQVKDTDKVHFGLSAQDVQKIMPEVVIDGERLSVATTEIIPVLIRAIQELKNQIDNLNLTTK